MSHWQLVIFDCDGVLVDSERISNGVLAEMLSAQGLPTMLAQARRDYQGLLLADVLERAQERLGRALSKGWLAQYEQERAAQAMEVDPRRCVVVEDTASGIAAAVAADMRAIGYAADSDERALELAGAEIIHALNELPGRLQR